MSRLAGILTDWRLHLSVLAVTILSELIGVVRIPIGIGAILLLPLLYAFVFGLLLNPNVVSRAKGWLRESDSRAATPLIVIAIMPFIAKFGTLIGPSINTIIEAGPALLLQELGNLGTIVLAFPIAVLLLGMGREAIGACFSIAREPNIAIIADRYGLKSQEGAGVMGVYVVGTLFGTFIFAILASVLATMGVFSAEALAMACGVGSGSMMAACTGALASAVPELTDDITALAGASNLLTYATGLYLGIFVALPMTEWAYRIFTGRRAAVAGGPAGEEVVAAAESPEAHVTPEKEPELDLGSHAVVLVLISAIILVGNTLGPDKPVIGGLVGLAILYAMVIAGLALTRLAPVRLPSVAWISLVGIVVTLPFIPGSEWIVSWTAHADFLALATPCLAYAGLAIGRDDVAIARRSGWRILVVAILVLTGTYVGSALVADLLL